MAKEAAKSAPEAGKSVKKTDKATSGKAAKKNDKKKESFGKKFTRFFKDLRSEIKKVVWPSKKQVKNNTLVVLAFMAVAAVFVWGIDAILSFLMNLLIK